MPSVQSILVALIWAFALSPIARATDVTHLVSGLGGMPVGWQDYPGNTTDHICSGEGFVSASPGGSWYDYNFFGTNASVYLLQARDAALIQVWFDGEFVELISPYNASEINPWVTCKHFVWKTPMMRLAPHIITIYHDGSPGEIPEGLPVYMRINKFVHTYPDDLDTSASTSSLAPSSSTISSSPGDALVSNPAASVDNL